MGTVHLARLDGPGGFRKWLAIKTCLPSRNKEIDIASMFLDEAAVAARISHPNVVSVFDCGVEEGVHYLAMEYLHGEPVREVVRHVEACGVPLPVQVACKMIVDAAEGLHAAHEARNDRGESLDIVHRDVTPHNLFVTYDGTVKLVDFGVAKFRTKANETRIGTLKGKVAYMSPEQARGDTVDRRADVFALGIILWELTTGRRLFRGDDILDTIAKVLEQEVPRPTRLVRGYPADLEKVVLKALAKRREERFQTAHEFARALMEVLIRRGLFVTNDEVLLYMQAAFSERIQERDGVLRTAAALSLVRDPSFPELTPPPTEVDPVDVLLDEAAAAAVEALEATGERPSTRPTLAPPERLPPTLPPRALSLMVTPSRPHAPSPPPSLVPRTRPSRRMIAFMLVAMFFTAATVFAATTTLLTANGTKTSPGVVPTGAPAPTAAVVKKVP
jgi:serine/threonine-protein kinase